ncbi:MAG: hypothetical protein IJS99_01020 [Synergistaceae bacterium]|nr:hypothetical protein [Synergistaceae bacterium]
MIYSFELNEEERKIVEEFAARIGQTVGEAAKECLLDEIDLAKQADEAWAEYEANPVTYRLVAVPVESE